MLSAASDEDLVRRAVSGSNGAWHKLVKRHERRVYNYALRMVGHPDDALDLMQEVFIGVHRNLASFRGDAKFTTWLFRIASFRCTDYLRRRRFHDSIDDVHPLHATGTEPDENAFTTLANQHITSALAKLPLEQRQVVELKFFQQFTFEDIANQLGISPNTAKTRLYSALGKLREEKELRDAL